MLHIRNLEEGVELFKVLGSDIRVNIILLLLKEKEMNMNEIATAVRQKLPMIEIIVNNHVLGMVRQWQDLFYEKRYSATVLDDGVDFVKLAEAMGAKGYRVTSQEEFKEAFKEALESEVPVLIDCIINCDDKVWPMVAPGEAISSSFTGEDLAKKQQS